MHRLARPVVVSAFAMALLGACSGSSGGRPDPAPAGADASGPSAAAQPPVAPPPAPSGPSAPGTPPAAAAPGLPPAPTLPPPIVPATAAGGFCSTSDFCWVEPLPQGASLKGIWVADANEAWAAGPRGALLRWDGTRWTRVPTGHTGRIWAVWGTAKDDVWAVGDAILHFDGASWRTVRSAPAKRSYFAVHGSGPGDVWAVGADGLVARFDGATWTDGVIPFQGEGVDALDVYAPGNGEAWVIGSWLGTVARYRGGAWELSAVTAGELNAIWGSGPDDVWIVGSARYEVRSRIGNHVFHWDGSAWSGVDVPGAEDAHWKDVSGGSGDVWLVAGSPENLPPNRAHWNGASWATSRVGAPANAVDVRAGAGFAVGDGGAVARLEGGAWTVQHAGYPHWTSDVATRDGVAWIAAQDTLTDTKLLRYSAGVATELSMGVSELVYGVAVTGPDELWVATRSRGLARFDGARWTMDAGGIGPLTPVRGVWASGPSDVWAMLGAELAHWDGARLTRYPVDAQYLSRAWGSASDDVWAVGDTGSAHHWDGLAWTKVSLPVDGLTLAVWGRARDDVWIVGHDGLALHYDGGAWSRVETGTRATLNAVTGDSSGRVWVAGDDGTVIEWTAAGFVALDTGSFSWLNGAAWDPTLGLVVAGNEGVLQRSR